MKKILRRIFLGVTVLLVLILAGTYWSYRAAQEPPEFYQEAVSSQAEQRTAGEELEAKASTLYSDLNRAGKWKLLLTAEQINGWLAVDLIEKHPGVLPPDVSDPRVAITPKQVSMGVLTKGGGIETVISVDAEVYLSEPNVVAVRILRARAGRLVLPRKQVLDNITLAANQAEIPLTWSQTEGDPVALFTLDLLTNHKGQSVTIEKLELHEGEIYVAGSTKLESEKQNEEEDSSPQKIEEPSEASLEEPLPEETPATSPSVANPQE